MPTLTDEQIGLPNLSLSDEDIGLSPIQSLNQTEGADPSHVWQGSLGKTLVEQGRRGMGWMQTPLINLPRFGPEYTQNPNAKPWQLFTEGAVNRVVSDVEGMSTFPNMVLAPLTLGQGIIAQFLRPALVSLFGTKILGEQLPQAAGDASVKLIPSSSPVLPGAPESFSPSEKGESAAGVADLSVLGALLAHSAKPIDSLRVPTEPKLLGSDINPNLTLRDINEIQGQIPPERQLTQFNPTMATRGPDVLGARPGQVPIPLPERSGDIIPLLRDPRRQLMAPGEGEQLQQQQMQDAVARMIQERQYSMEGRDVRPSPIRLPETAGKPSPTTLQLKGPPTFISGGEPSSTVSQETLSSKELTEFQREVQSGQLLTERKLQDIPFEEQAQKIASLSDTASLQSLRKTLVNLPVQEVPNQRKDLLGLITDRQNEIVSGEVNPKLEALRKPIQSQSPTSPEIVDPASIANLENLTYVGEQKPQVPGMQGLWEFRLKEPGKEMFSVTTKAGATVEEVKTAKQRKLEEVQQTEPQRPRLQGLQLKPTMEQLKQKGQEGSINVDAIKETFKSWLGDKSGLDRPDRPSPAQKVLKTERIKAILLSPTAKPLETRPEYRAQPGEKTTLGQKIVNKIRSAQNAVSKGDKLLLPIDVILDDLDGGKADYKGPLFQQVRWPLDDDFNNELQRRDLYTKPIVDIVKENKLKKENGERIGVYAETLQENGRQRLIDSGVKPSVIDNIVKTITPAELKAYSEMRKQLDSSLPEVQKLAKELYETDVQPVKNYFPRLRNWEIFEPEASEIAGPKVGEKATQDLVSWRELSQDYTRKGTKTEQGYTIERQPNAKTGIKVNAFEVYDRHMKDVAHFLAMQKNLKEIGEIVRSENFKKKYGDQGQSLLTDWLNVVAKQGRYKRNAILDTIRKNVAKGVIAFRIPSQLVHLANVPLAQERAGPIWHARGMEASLTDEGQAFLHKHFTETFERGGGEPGLQEAERGPITKAGFWLQRELDRLNAQATVLGVYMKRIEGKGKNPQEYHSLPVDMNAVREARVLARRAVASPIYKDVPLALTKGGSGAKFFFQFQNTFLDQWSNIRYDLVQAGLGKNFLNNPKLASRMALAIAMMLLVETGIKYGAKQVLNKATGYEPKDEESFKGKLLHEALKRVPGMGQAMAIAQYDETGVPGADVVKQVVKGTKQAIAADDTKGRILAGGKAATAVAELAGVPGASQVSEIAQSYAKGKFFETHEKRLEEIAGKPLEQMTLRERRDAEKQLKEQRGPRSREDEAKGAATAIKQNAKRGGELQDGLKEEVKTWLNGKGLKVPNYDDTVSYGKQRLVLTTEEQTRFKELLTEEYDRFLTPWVGKNVKQEQVSQRLEQATARARHRLLKEMKR